MLQSSPEVRRKRNEKVSAVTPSEEKGEDENS